MSRKEEISAEIIEQAFLQMEQLSVCLKKKPETLQFCR